MREIHVTYYTLSPLAHGGFGASSGNATTIRREPVVSVEGAPLVPCISGNSIRGQVRRILMRSLLGKVGLGPGTMPDRQWDFLYAALANGGHLTGKEATPSPEEVRALRQALPPLSVLGSAMYRYLLTGWARFGFVWPVCQETVEAGLVSIAEGATPAGDIVTETGLVRHIDRDQQDPSITGVTPMPVTVEAIATGVTLEQTIRVQSEATDVEAAAIVWGLERIAHLGGKSAGGLGEVDVRHDGDSTPYQRWLDALEVDKMRDYLLGLAASIA